MSCECYQIGGRFIAEDPDCEVHCAGGLAERLELAEIEADRRRDDFAERALLNAAKRDELHARAKVVLQKGHLFKSTRSCKIWIVSFPS